jgi:hypothetical protein
MLKFFHRYCAPFFLCMALVWINSSILAQDATPEIDSPPESTEATSTEAATAPAPLLVDLVGKIVDIQTTKKYLTNAKIVEIEPGKLENSIKKLKITVGGKHRKLAGSKVVEIFTDGQPMDLNYERKQVSLVHSPSKRAARLAYETRVNDQLSSTGQHLWEPLTNDEQLEFLRKQEAFINKIRNTMPSVRWRLVETNYFIFLTDLNPSEVDGYIVYLDAMYQQLCKAFGIPPEKNIWCGKCMIVAFREKPTYIHFESAVMNFNKAEGTQGLCHQEFDGSVLFAGYKGTNNFFGHVLVHETSHGFVHRYLSSARAPSWLNEGMADWLAHQVVKGEHIPRRQKASAAKMKAQGNWGNILTAERISPDHYGVSSVLVQILLSRDRGGQFKKYFDGIKEGRNPERCLKEFFNLSYIDLEILYAKAIANWN